MAPVQVYPGAARVHWGERANRPTNPRPGQEEQPMGREGQMSHHVNRGHQCAPDSACRPPGSLAGPLLAVLLFHLRHQQRGGTRGWNNPQHLQQQQQHCSPYQSSGQSYFVRRQALGMVSRLGHPFKNAACPWTDEASSPMACCHSFCCRKALALRVIITCVKW